MLHSIERSIHFRNSFKNGISAIYINTVLRKLSLSLVGFFLPVFIFTKSQEYFGYGITGGLYGLIFYFLIWEIVKMFLLIPSANLIAKLGYRWTITISNLFWMSLLVTLYFSDKNTLYLFLAPVLHGAATSLFWLSYHSLFAEDGHVSHIGNEVGATHLLGTIISVIGPLTGGLIIDYSGFESLFLLALIIMAASSLPFFFLPHHKPKLGVSLNELINWFREKKHLNEIVSISGRGMEEHIVTAFWPVYMFIVAGTYGKQGFSASLSLFLGALAIYVSGKYMDKEGNRVRLLFGTVGTSFVWALRGFVSNFSHLILVDSLMALISPFYWINFESLVYKDARLNSEKNLLFMTAKLFITSFAFLAVLLIALAFANTSLRFVVLFVLAIAGSLLSYFIWESRKKK